jgi:hypothetical protein
MQTYSHKQAQKKVNGPEDVSLLGEVVALEDCEE